jgi:prolipoprotein diacylglyceryltransferase
VGSPAFSQQRMEGLLGPDAVRSLPVHPTQLYESAIGLLLLLMLLLVRRYRRFSGQMFVAFTMGYAVLRYGVERLRADEQRGSLGPLSTSQIIAIATFLAGAAGLAWIYARYRRAPAELRLWEEGRAVARTQATKAPLPRGRRR